MPNSLNTQTAQSAVPEITSECTQMGQNIVLAADSCSAAALVFGLYKMKEKGCSMYHLELTFQKIHARLSALGRLGTLSRVVSGYYKLLNGDYAIPPNMSSSSFHTMTKKAPLRASKPVISINIGAKRQSTTTKAVQQMPSPSTNPCAEIPF